MVHPQWTSFLEEGVVCRSEPANATRKKKERKEEGKKQCDCEYCVRMCLCMSGGEQGESDACDGAFQLRGCW